MAHKKAGGSTRNGRDSHSKRLGVKKFGGEDGARGQHSDSSARHPVSRRRQRRHGYGPHPVCHRARRSSSFGSRARNSDTYVNVVSK